MHNFLVGSRTCAWIAVLGLTVWAWRTPPIRDQPDWNALGIVHSQTIVYRTDGAQRLRLEVYQPSRSHECAEFRAAIARGPRRAWRKLERGFDDVVSVRRTRTWSFVWPRAGSSSSRSTTGSRSQSSPSWPAVIDDLREAVRWLRRNSATYGVDPDRIATIGQSSGGHLAALLGTLPAVNGPDGVSSRVQAVVSLYGPSDLTRLMHFRHLAHEPARALLGDETPGAN